MEGAILMESSNPENVIKLTSGEFSIGRSLNCSYVVEDLHVSRQHCEFQFNDNKWFVMDQSSYGTFLNNQLLDEGKKYVLKEGDVISLNDRCKYTLKMGNKESAELNQKFNIAFLEETAMVCLITSLGEKKKKRKSKRKLNNDESTEESEDVGSPKTR